MLGAESWRQRQHAEDELVAMGAAVKPAVAEALARVTDTEVQARLEAVLRRLADKAATGPTLVTIRLKGASAQDAFAEFARQAGSGFRLVPENLWQTRPFSPADIDIDDQPYWIALRKLCEIYGLQLQNAGDRDLSLVDRTASGGVFGKAPWLVHGPFMVIASAVSRSQSSELNFNQNTSRYCSVQLLVLAEPKLRVLQGSYMASLKEALDENGNSLLAGNANLNFGFQRLSGRCWNLQATLKPADPLGQRIARLAGSGRYWLQTRSEKNEIVNPSEAIGRPQRVGSRMLTIKDFKRQGETWQLKIAVSRIEWAGNDLNALQDVNGSIVRLLDVDGRALPRVGGVSSSFTADNMMEMLFTFGRTGVAGVEKLPDPVRLVLEMATEMKEVEVPFEFTNLPMP